MVIAGIYKYLFLLRVLYFVFPLSLQSISAGFDFLPGMVTQPLFLKFLGGINSPASIELLKFSTDFNDRTWNTNRCLRDSHKFQMNSSLPPICSSNSVSSESINISVSPLTAFLTF